MIRVAIIAFTSFFGCCQAHGEVFSYPFNPDIGSKWFVHEVRTKTTNDPDKPPETTGEVMGKLEVIGHTEEGYVYTWTTSLVEVKGIILSVENSDPSLMIGVPITFEAAADGTPIRIQNVEELLSNAEKALSLSGGATTQQAEEAVSLITETDQETLSAMLLQQANLVGSCQGYQLDSDNPIEQNALVPSIGGAPPILTILRVSLIDPGDENRPAIIESYQAFDPESAAHSMFVLFTQISEQQGRPAPQKSEVPPLERTTTVTCEVDVESGETVNVISDMTVKAQGMEQSDFRSISVKRLDR